MPTKKKNKPCKPRGRPFPKGVSGNPSGMPKADREVKPLVETPLREVGDNVPELLAQIDRCLGEPHREEVLENLRWRRRILEATRGLGKKEAGRFWLRVWGACRKSIRFYINAFVWQYNPNTEPGREVSPFVLWDFQEAALYDRPERDGAHGMLWMLEHEGNFLIEKSREMGASWLLLLLQDWRCRFYEWQSWGWVSRDADAVDKTGDPDALFWKLDHIHQNLPGMLQGERRELKERKRFYIHYPRTHSTVTGQASTGKAFVGGRKQVVIVDEYSEIVEDKRVRQKLASTARVRFYNGTHNGTGTEFYALSRQPETYKRLMHWIQHPAKNGGLYRYDTNEHGHKKVKYFEYVPGGGLRELAGPTYAYAAGFAFVLDGSPTGGPWPGLRSPWYDGKSKEIGNARGVAEDLDIDPKGSAFRPFDPLILGHLKAQCRPPLWEGDVEVDSKGNVIGLTRRQGGPLKLWARLEDDRPASGVYAAGADVALGVGATLSAVSIFNCRTGEKVLRYANAHISPDKFGLVLAALCRLFHGARVAWENAGPGVLAGKAMQDAGYYNLYEMGEEEKTWGSGRTRTVGFKPNANANNLLLNRYYLALQNGEVQVYDEPALDEMLEFKYDQVGKIIHPGEAGSDPAVARENHGDLVRADALAAKLVIDGGRLASRQPADKPEIAAEDNIMTIAGRQALRRRTERAMSGW